MVRRNSREEVVIDSDAEALCCLIRVMVVFVVILVELLLLVNGWTFTPWFFIWLVPLLMRPPRRQEDGANRGSARQQVPRDEEEVDVSDDGETASAGTESPRAKARASNTKDGFSMIKNDDVSRIITEQESTLAILDSTFQDAVDRARTNASVGALGSKPVVDDSNELDGTYELEFESDGKLVTATMKLRFTSGFEGWTIQGTRNNPGEDGTFRLHKGFLAQSGPLYWEERAEFEPFHSVLVQGKVTPDGPFRGDWLSSDGDRHKGIVTEFRRVRSFDDEDASSESRAADLV